MDCQKGCRKKQQNDYEMLEVCVGIFRIYYGMIRGRIILRERYNSLLWEDLGGINTRKWRREVGSVPDKR